MDNIQSIINYSKNITLLYVEDNKEARESTLAILEEFFENIIIDINGADGFATFQSNKIDLIITDINMPVLNGLDMIAKIREVDKDLPILVLSAYNESGYFMDSIKLGVDGYMLKPIDMEQFLLVLEKTISKLQIKEEARNNLHFLKQYEEATNNSSIVSKTDLKGIITYANDAFCQISEYSLDELIGRNHNIVRHPDDDSAIYKELWDTIKNKKAIWKGIIRNISKSGKSYYVKSTIKPILDANNNIIEYIALRNNITDIMNPKRQLQDFVDSNSNSLAVMLKIENFDNIEKFYYQKTVQKIEKSFGEILMQNIPQNCEFDMIFPLGSGEYVFVKNADTCIIDLDSIILNLKELQEKINDIKIDIGEVDYDISIIISLAQGNNVLENIKYGIKQLISTNQDFIVANNLAQIEQNSAKRNLETLKTIKKAINDFNIICYFQPIINNKTSSIEKYESLVRLVNEKGEILSPFSFLDIAKKGKYYTQITEMVLNNSFNALQNTKMDISINLSALDIERKSTREKLFSLLEKNKKDASRVVFELLEDENVKDFETIKKFIKDVKNYGVKIAIDDFGAGYSNFERLLDYQPDILKIDGSLVKNIVTDSFSLNVIETIVSFAKKQNILTIAEYVENEEIFNILNSLGVDYSQGYYFGKPSPLK